MVTNRASKPIQIQTTNLNLDTGYPSPLSPTGANPLPSAHTLPFRFTQDYRLGRRLGFGGFGFVYSCTRKYDGLEVACKFIYKSKMARSCWTKDKDLGVCPMEVAVLKNVRHPNIIEFIDYFEDDVFCYCVTELHGSSWAKSTTSTGMKSPAMDLFECIEQHESFGEDRACFIFKQILSAVSHLHEIGLVHRDIKDENILIDESYRVKLIDFGSAAFYDPTGKTGFDAFLGTKQYASPEILRGQPYRGPEADVWALGCCLYIVLTATVPFTTLEQTIQAPFNTPNRYLDPMCLHLLERMLEKDYTKRATIKEILAHPWVTGFYH